jgi:CTP synthase (UTP-ammonia lyase)
MNVQHLTDAITDTLRPHAHLHDVEAIVEWIGSNYGDIDSLDDVPAMEYWATVEQCTR